MPWSGLPAFFLGLTEAEKTQEVGVLDVQVTCEPEYLVHFPELKKRTKYKQANRKTFLKAIKEL